MTQVSKFDEVRALGLVVEERPRTIIDKFVYVLGYKLNADDLYQTLEEVQDSPSHTVMTNKHEVEAMKLIGVIESTSNSWGTAVGPNLDAFILMLRVALHGEGA